MVGYLRSTALWVVAFFCVSCASPTGKAPADFEELRGKAQEAKQLVLKGNFDEAEQTAQEVVQQAPGILEAHSTLAVIHVAKKRPAEALAKFAELVRENPKHPQFALALGTLQLLQGRAPEGLESMKKVLEQTSFSLHLASASSGSTLTSFPLPEDPVRNCCPKEYCFYWPFFYQLGILAIQVGEVQKNTSYLDLGRRFLEKVYEFHPQHPQVEWALLRFHLHNSPFDQVYRFLEMRSDAKEFLAFVGAASQYYFEKKAYPQSAQILLFALGKKPKSFQILRSLGYVLLHIPQLNAQAMTVLNAALQQKGNDEIALFLFAIACLREKTDRAYYWAYKSLKTLAPKNNFTYLLLYAIACERLGKIGEAYQVLQKCLGMKGDEVDAVGNLSALLISQGAFWHGSWELEERSLSHPWLFANLAMAYKALGYEKVQLDWLRRTKREIKQDVELRERIFELK